MMEQNEAAAIIDALVMSEVIVLVRVPDWNNRAKLCLNLDTEDESMTKHQFIKEILAVQEDGVFLVRPANVYGFFALKSKWEEHRAKLRK